MCLHLRRRHKCRVVQPEWLRADTLETVKDEEKDNQFFTKMPNK